MNTPAVLFLGDLVIVARQARLISEARSRGLAPLLIVTPDTDPDRMDACRADPTHPLSALEEVVLVPDATIDDVLPVLPPLLRRYDIHGVLCVGDLFVEPTNMVADILGLPGAGTKAGRSSRNKLLQRLAVPQLAPPYVVVTDADRARPPVADLPFPVVVKPVARFSSIGVRQVATAAELPDVLVTYPAGETLLVEGRVHGPEFSIESLVQGGTVLWSQVTAKRTNDATGIYFTEMGHTCPAPIPEADRDALLAANARILTALGFRDGVTHAELRLAADGPVMMEIATRVPGDGITFLWELATGRPLEPVMIDLALGVPAAYPEPRRRAAQVYLDHPHGRLVDVVSEHPPPSWVERDDRWPEHPPAAPEAPAAVRSVIVARMPGDELGPQTDSEQRSVSVVADMPLGEAEPFAVADRLASAVSIVVEPMAVLAGAPVPQRWTKVT